MKRIKTYIFQATVVATAAILMYYFVNDDAKEGIRDVATTTLHAATDAVGKVVEMVDTARTSRETESNAASIQEKWEKIGY